MGNQQIKVTSEILDSSSFIDNAEFAKFINNPLIEKFNGPTQNIYSGSRTDKPYPNFSGYSADADYRFVSVTNLPFKDNNIRPYDFTQSGRSYYTNNNPQIDNLPTLKKNVMWNVN